MDRLIDLVIINELFCWYDINIFIFINGFIIVYLLMNTTQDQTIQNYVDTLKA